MRGEIEESGFMNYGRIRTTNRHSKDSLCTENADPASLGVVGMIAKELCSAPKCPDCWRASFAKDIWEAANS